MALSFAPGQPSVINFGAVTPGDARKSVMFVASSAANVTARIDGGGGRFRVDSVTCQAVFEQKLTPEEIAQLPRHLRNDPRYWVSVERTIVGTSDGVTPVAVESQNEVVVNVAYRGEDAAGQGVQSATLVILATGGNPISVPVSALVADLSVEILTPMAEVRQGGETSLIVRIVSRAGPATEARFTLHDAPFLVVLDGVRAVGRGETTEFAVHVLARTDTPVKTREETLLVTAFDGLFELRLHFELTVRPGKVNVTALSPGPVVGIQGQRLTMPVRISAAGLGPDVVFQPSALPVGVSMPTQTLPAASHQTVDRVLDIELHADAPLHAEAPLSVQWTAGSAGSGTLSFLINVLPRYRAPIEFKGLIVTGGLAALGGSFKVTIYPDGAVRWEGVATNSGVDSYEFGISALIRTGSGRAVALVHTGSIPNLIIGDTIRRPWNEFHEPKPLITAHFAEFANASFSTNLEYQGGIEETLVKTVGWLIEFGVGSVIGPAGGAVVFVGITAGSLAMTGSLVPGARIVGNVLWLAGPANTLFALAAEGIAAAGDSTHDPIPSEWYDWANGAVFLGALPPREKLVLTNTIGGGERPFTFPRFDDKITLNMGPEAFADPRLFNINHPDQKKQRKWGQVFIHELVHACQIHHSNIDLSFMADAIASKVCETTQGQTVAYSYGPAGFDYTKQSLEPQAQIVSDWYAKYADIDQVKRNDFTSLQRPEAVNDAYYRYIVENVRVGRF